jgi:hypothetical protein
MPEETFDTLSEEEREELVFSACDEPYGKRDWTPSKKKFIRKSITTRMALLHWLKETVSEESWTLENRRFVEELRDEGSL